jgi:magnesium transporter
VDVYDRQLLIVAHALTRDTEEGGVDTEELDIVLAPNVVLTYHRATLETIDAAGALLSHRGSGLDRPILLIHRILDGLNDRFVPVLDQLGARLDEVEHGVDDAPGDDEVVDEIFRLRRDLISVRRFAVPQAEAIGRLARVHSTLVPSDDQPLFRDVYDHLYRLSEVTESYRQLVDSAYDSFLIRREQETNRRITLLTMVSSIALPITVVAGIYGMNFAYMPELDESWAYPTFWVIVIALVVFQVVIFRKWGWIGRRSR